MKITQVRIDRFGVWRGLNIEGFGEGINVLYGPNEAGKTTLLEFIRGVFYGFDRAAAGYLVEPTEEGLSGGSLVVRTDEGQFEVARRLDFDRRESVTIVADDGTHFGEHYLKTIVGEAGEALFRTVFAIGLDELQALSALSDGEAADLLYRLAVGIDPSVPVGLIRELDALRRRWYDGPGRPSHIARLLDQRAKTQAAWEDLLRQSQAYWRYAAQRDQLNAEIAALEAELRQIEERIRLYDLALALQPQWIRRGELLAELRAVGDAVLPDEAIDRLRTIDAGQQEVSRRLADVREELALIKQHDAPSAAIAGVLRIAPRLAALREQETYLTQLIEQNARCERAVAESDHEAERLAAECGLRPGEPLPTIDRSSRTRLRRAASGVRRAARRVRLAEDRAAECESRAREAERRLKDALRQGNAESVAAAIEDAGRVAAQWRRRLHIDERITQLGRYREELEEESHRLTAKQLLPLPVLAVLGGVFALGIMLFLLALVFPQYVGGGWGLTIAAMGVAGSAAAALGKWMFEKYHAERLDGVRKQLELLDVQRKQAEEDRDALDRQLPRGSGPLAARAKAAEAEVAQWEALLPVEAQYVEAIRDGKAAADRMNEATRELRSAEERWHDAVRRAGLRGSPTPSRLRQLLPALRRLRELNATKRQLVEEQHRAQRELRALADRIAQCARDAGAAVNGSPLDQLRQLGELLDQAEAAEHERLADRRRRRLLLRQMRKLIEARARWKHRRRALWAACGVGSDSELRQKAEQARRADAIKAEAVEIDRSIEMAVAGRFALSNLVELWESGTAAQWTDQREHAQGRAASAQRELGRRLEQRGDLNKRLGDWDSNYELDRLRLELASLDEQLLKAQNEWRTTSFVCRAFEQVRLLYETERQPETLVEASRFFQRLTEGRYERVWTPMGEQSLRVDDCRGRCWPIESLSRGTREQLFLALRLALAAYFSRHGMDLPLTLDDVLVNFDADRLSAAVEVLADYAGQRQVIVFTCHDSLLELFARHQSRYGRLPPHAERPLPLLRLTRWDRAEPVASARRRRALPVAVAAEERSDAAAAVGSDEADVSPPAQEPAETTGRLAGEKAPEPQPTAPPTKPPATESLPESSESNERLATESEANEPAADTLSRRRIRRRPAERAPQPSYRPGKSRGVFDADYFSSEDASG